MRMFVALRPPAEAVEDLSAFLEPRRAAFDLRWTPPDRWHLTLAFVESVPDHALDRFEETLAAAALRRHRLALRLAGGGAFPDPFGAKVVYAVPAMADACRHELGRLAAGARTAAATSGLTVDGARFVPHVTLARSRHAVRAHRLIDVLDTYAGPSWVAGEVELVASHLREGRSGRHEVLARFPLGPTECTEIRG